MTRNEFFLPGDQQTETLNQQGDLVYKVIDIHSEAAMRIKAAEYMKAIIDSDNMQALKYAISTSMSGHRGNEGADSSLNVHNTVKGLAEEDASYTDKFGNMLVRLLHPNELPPLDPNNNASEYVYDDQRDYRYYTTMLLDIAAYHPKSPAVFEAAYSLTVSGDPRIHARDLQQGYRFTDNQLPNVLANHQTDERLQATWQAALIRQPSSDPASLYPGVIDIGPGQAFNGIRGMRENTSTGEMVVSDVIADLEMARIGLQVLGIERGEQSDNAIDALFIERAVCYLEESQRAKILAGLSEHYANEPATLKAIEIVKKVH